MRVGPNSRTSGNSATRLRAAEASRISSHMPARRRCRPSSAVYASWSERIPAAAYALRARSRTPGAWPSTCSASSSFGELAWIAGDDAREVHHLGEADHAAAPEQPFQVAGRQPAAGDSKSDAGTHEDAITKTSSGRSAARVEEPVHPVRAEHVRDLVRVGDDRGRSQRQHEPRELVDEELGRFEVDVRVDEAGNDPAARRVDSLVYPRSRRVRRRRRRRSRRRPPAIRV